MVRTKEMKTKAGEENELATFTIIPFVGNLPPKRGQLADNLFRDEEQSFHHERGSDTLPESGKPLVPVIREQHERQDELVFHSINPSFTIQR